MKDCNFLISFSPYSTFHHFFFAFYIVIVLLVAQSCPTLWDPLDCNPPGSSVHGVLQARTLEWVAISSSRGPSQPRGQTQVSYSADRVFTIWSTREAPVHFAEIVNQSKLLRSNLGGKYNQVLGMWGVFLGKEYNSHTLKFTLFGVSFYEFDKHVQLDSHNHRKVCKIDFFNT